MTKNIIFEWHNWQDFVDTNKVVLTAYRLLWIYKKKIDEWLRFPPTLAQYFPKENYDIDKFSFRYFSKSWTWGCYLHDEITRDRVVWYFMEWKENLLLFYEDVLICWIWYGKYKDWYIVYQIQGIERKDGKNWILDWVDWADFLLSSLENLVQINGLKTVYVLPGLMNAWKNNIKLDRTTWEKQYARLQRIYDNTATNRGYILEQLDPEKHPQKLTIQVLGGKSIDPKLIPRKMKVWKKKL